MSRVGYSTLVYWYGHLEIGVEYLQGQLLLK